jgi:histidinol phosphatase-like enzyme
MNAKEANQKTLETLKQLVDPQYKIVMIQIEGAILRGSFHTIINTYLYSEVIEKLKIDGYKIKTYWRKHGVYKISWK